MWFSCRQAKLPNKDYGLPVSVSFSLVTRLYVTKPLVAAGKKYTIIPVRKTEV